MPNLSEFNSTLLKELEDVFTEIRKQEQALEKNRKGMVDVMDQIQKGAPAYGVLGMQGVQITNEIKQREHELGKLKERRQVILVRIPFFQLAADE